jgi:glyoxalase family protein
MALVDGFHHLTMSVDGAQEDFDFFTRTLGLHSVKKTVLFDGTTPVYHLYYGGPNGEASTIITTFPFKLPGIYGRRGTNQSRVIQLAVPVGSLPYWEDRLGKHGVPARRISRFGVDRIEFKHPCGIEMELVAAPNDDRPTIAENGVDPAHGIKGIYGIGVAVFDKTSMDDFLTVGLGMTRTADEADQASYRMPSTGPVGGIEVMRVTDEPQGTWTLAGGTIHHFALNTMGEENQFALKAQLEGMGFTDVSEQKDRNYFKSCYVRSPGGALVELAWTVPGGWALDEPADKIGQSLVFPPWFMDRKDEMVAGLEKFDW